MSGPVFDKDLDPMGDLTLKMTEELEPEEIINTDDIEGDVESVEASYEAPPERPVDEIFVKKNKKVKIQEPAVKPDKLEEDWSESITNDEPPRIRGERGKDKKKRKKRVMTPAALEKLKIAREKSLATRRAKAAAKKKAKEDARATAALEKRRARAPKENVKLEVIKEETQFKMDDIPKQKPANVFDDFDKFCSFMDRYDERRKKKHSTSRQPHPNQKIPERHRPRAPIRPTNRNPQFRQTGGHRARSPPPADFSPYSLLKRGRTLNSHRRNGMNGGWDNNGW